MNNSIWKTPDQKPDVFKPHTIMVVYEAHDEAELMLSTQYESYTADRYINRWCYLDELLAQADKVERLQKAVCFIRNIRGAGMSYQDMFLDAHEVAKTALDPEYKPILCGRYDEEILDEIQQLIKGE